MNRTNLRGRRRKHKSRRTVKIRNFITVLVLLVALLAAGRLLLEKLTADQNSDDSEDDSVDLTLVNRWNEIPADYTVDLTQLSNGESVATSIYPALQEMFDAARAHGIYPVVASGYRTASKQQSLLDDKIADFVDQGYSEEEATTMAEKCVSVPGTSEHQLGLAVDINADPMKSTADEVYTWLAENAYKYGFILRYPEGKEEITATNYEAWHYRYVGKTAAQEIYEQGLCFEEYLDQLNQSEASKAEQ